MGAPSCRAATAAASTILATIFSFATPAFAETATISAADTTWMIVATALVLMMTVPGLALFYSGMVRKKNVLAQWRKALQPWPLFRFSGLRSAIRWHSSATAPALARSIAGFS